MGILVGWPDTAQSYKSVTARASKSVFWMQRYDVHKGHAGIHETDVLFERCGRFGEPCHLKGMIDRIFGALDGRADALARRRVVSGMPDIATAIRAKAYQTKDEQDEVLIEFWPTTDRATWMRDHPRGLEGVPPGVVPVALLHRAPA